MTAKADATGTPIHVEYDGEDYEIQPAAKWDLDVLESYEDGKILSTVRALLGPDGWAKFRAKPRNVGDLEGMMNAIQSGLGLGN